jgi:hypothetical protein
MNLPKYEHCVACHEPFNDINTHTRAGWLETQTSGLCEDCFDACFEDKEEYVDF